MDANDIPLKVWHEMVKTAWEAESKRSLTNLPTDGPKVQYQEYGLDPNDDCAFMCSSLTCAYYSHGKYFKLEFDQTPGCKQRVNFGVGLLMSAGYGVRPVQLVWKCALLESNIQPLLEIACEWLELDSKEWHTDQEQLHRAVSDLCKRKWLSKNPLYGSSIPYQDLTLKAMGLETVSLNLPSTLVAALNLQAQMSGESLSLKVSGLLTKSLATETFASDFQKHLGGMRARYDKLRLDVNLIAEACRKAGVDLSTLTPLNKGTPTDD